MNGRSFAFSLNHPGAPPSPYSTLGTPIRTCSCISTAGLPQNIPASGRGGHGGQISASHEPAATDASDRHAFLPAGIVATARFRADNVEDGDVMAMPPRLDLGLPRPDWYAGRERASRKSFLPRPSVHIRHHPRPGRVFYKYQVAGLEVHLSNTPASRYGHQGLVVRISASASGCPSSPSL